ncbi:hypothetical protein SPBR_04773 [Sporothrix brasiliensis 5110]|uniref:Carboxylic ester hydrolase n=1 Tax=Sporothrix brasiliensis 5110 TaxID=1398154 RepID=A0A0C2ENI2_9PEZI|nr:uncharacterized protein SPBR_04773 [Sporothrix brasiliensis 5110]KIH87659.1 hypothetical protein SPBR_04773 [Sporothrix brasiliensis 5110]
MVHLRHAVVSWFGCYLGLASQNDGPSTRRSPSTAYVAALLSAPTVAVKNGSYSGVYNPEYKQDFFLGIPYAQKPVRFQQAVPLNSTWDGVHEAVAYPPHCVGYGGDDVGYPVSEDCLYLNVVRPAGIDSTAGLPVAVWIHGGGLTMGGSADKRYNLTFIVENSVEQGTPIIGVSINYRLSAFGFLAGQAVRDAGSTNIGFRDQRLALHWVQDNIAAFGGAPDKVVIWGESSGAESVSAQTFAYNGRDDGLFRGVIGESGFGGFIARYPGNLNTTAKQQENYDQLVRNTSCASAPADATLDCLRRLPLHEINETLAHGNGSFFPVLDGDFIADYPHNQIRNGRFVHVPVLIGCNSDEGSGQGRSVGPEGKGVSTDAEFRAAIVQKFGLDGSTLTESASTSTPEKAGRLVDELLLLYPDIQAIGVPGLDKFPVIVPGDSLARSVGLQFRRSAALLGDNWMHYQRRRASLAWSAFGLPSWSYRFDVLVNGIAPQAGATHFQEVAFVFDNIHGLGYETNPFANMPPSYTALAKSMSKAWVNFFVDLDPNGKSGSGGTTNGSTNSNGLPTWPVYNATAGGGVGHNIVLQAGSSHVEPDTYRAEGIRWMIDHGLDVFGI